MIRLENNVKVFVPEEDNNGATVDFTNQINDMLLEFGGATVYKATGLWRDKNITYKDNMQVVQCNYGQSSFEQANAVQKLVRALFIKGGQLAISVEVNSELIIFESDDTTADVFKTLKEVL